MTICEHAGALVEELKQEMALFIEELRTLDEYIPTLTGWGFKEETCLVFGI
jgi:hypothetical protein